MAIGANSLIEISVNMLNLDQQTMNVWQYEISSYPGNVTMVQLLEAYWNHVKATYRAIAVTGFGSVFISLLGRELNDPTGDYAEYDIPTSEKAGTRAAPSESSRLPPFAAAGVRLTVGSRVTRPGQKRIPFLTESDNAQGELQAGFITLVNNLMNVMTADMLLGAPAATLTLNPIVTRKDSGGFVIASQDIEGYLVNPYVTTQNSRKYGRGS